MYIAASMHERSFLAFLFSFAPQIEVPHTLLHFAFFRLTIYFGEVPCQYPQGPLFYFLIAVSSSIAESGFLNLVVLPLQPPQRLPTVLGG